MVVYQMGIVVLRGIDVVYEVCFMQQELDKL